MSKASDRKVPKRVDPFISDDQRKADLETYCQIAIELGASDAKVIESVKVIVEDRVRGKCLIPKCPHYGTSANCPPYSPLPKEIRRMLKEYKQGVFIRLISDFSITPGTELLRSHLSNWDRRMRDIHRYAVIDRKGW